MKRPAELDDWDRDPVVQQAFYVLATGEIPPKPMSKRIPSPYAEPPRPIKRETDGAMIAFCCVAAIGTMLTVVGGVQVVRWIAEAVR